jgi:dUTP pyrophosphatase
MEEIVTTSSSHNEEISMEYKDNSEIKYTNLQEVYYEPYIGSTYAAGADLKAIENYTIYPGETVKVSTGIAIEIPNGYFGAIFARSGLATKKGLRPANCVGVIDSDYRGEIIVALHNDSDEKQDVEVGERIAQLVIMPYLPVTYKYTESLSETERGAAGFGSTGSK